jgi:hypothetical protein
MYKSRTGVRFGKFSNGAENLVLQALQFHWTVICRKFLGGIRISYYSPNECFMEFSSRRKRANTLDQSGRKFQL